MDALDMFVECNDVMNFLFHHTKWNKWQVTENVHRVVRFLQAQIEDGLLKCAENGDIKWAIYHLLATLDGGEDIARYFFQTRHLVPDAVIQRFLDRPGAQPGTD